ncbi:Sugar transporter ERD6-like 5 [Bienertia sinuspersici]
MGGASSLIVSEIFPLNIKGSAGSLVTIISQVAGWIVAYAFNFSMAWSSSGTFFILAGNCALTLLFVARLLPETKGKTLEQVHFSISKIWQ